MIYEPSVNAEETAVIVSVWRLDIIHCMYVLQPAIWYFQALDAVALMHASGCCCLGGICSGFKQVLETVLTCKGIAVVLASEAVRSCQIGWIPARADEQMEYIKALKL